MSELTAYVVRNKQSDLYMVILDIGSLHLHEETVPELLRQLIETIRADDCVRHPIIVDKDSLVVLDGVHRVVALRKLGIKRIPACLVNYNSQSIRVYTWFRTIKDGSPPDRVLAQVHRVGVALEESQDVTPDMIGVSPNAAAIRFRGATFYAKHPFENLEEAYAIVEKIEQRLRGAGFMLRYETESDALQSLQEGRIDAVLCTPKVDKKDIIEAAMSGHIFAYKATRHVIPTRPLNVNVPLSLLKQKRSLEDVNNELRKRLQKRNLRRLPPGSVVEGRRYEEELYVFEE